MVYLFFVYQKFLSRLGLSVKKEVVSLNIDKDIVDPEDVEMLEDLVTAAVNEGIRQIEEASAKAMEDITSGIEIPGMM